MGCYNNKWSAKLALGRYNYSTNHVEVKCSSRVRVNEPRASVLVLEHLRFAHVKCYEYGYAPSTSCECSSAYMYYSDSEHEYSSITACTSNSAVPIVYPHGQYTHGYLRRQNTGSRFHHHTSHRNSKNTYSRNKGHATTWKPTAWLVLGLQHRFSGLSSLSELVSTRSPNLDTVCTTHGYSYS